jgi:hypothetical protein
MSVTLSAARAPDVRPSEATRAVAKRVFLKVERIMAVILYLRE